MAVSESITVFHGTGLKNIPNILEKGLLAQAPIGTNNKGVFLTGDIETAAYYTWHFDKPIILEVKITTHKRLKKIVHDPLDRDSDAYDEWDHYDFEEDLEELDSIIKKVLEINNISYLGISLSEIEDIRGINIYKYILSYARANDLDINKIKNNIKEYLPPGQLTEYIEIAQDGTIILSQDAYQSMHQIMYPKNLPSATIKAVWIPESHLKPESLDKSLDQKRFGKRILPGDIKKLNNLILNLHFSADHNTIDDASSILDNIKDKDVFNIFDDLIKDLESAINDEDLEEIENILMFQDPLDVGETAQNETWHKFILPLSEVKGLYEL